MYKAACSVSALRPFGDVSVANQVNMEVTVVYETVCVVLHYETVSSLTSFSTSFPLRAGFPPSGQAFQQGQPQQTFAEHS